MVSKVDSMEVTQKNAGLKENRFFSFNCRTSQNLYCDNMDGDTPREQLRVSLNCSVFVPQETPHHGELTNSMKSRKGWVAPREDAVRPLSRQGHQ